MAFSEFRPLDEKSLIEYIKATPALSDKLGKNLDDEDLKIKEVGDGNLNFVYIVVGQAGSLVIKQALPYIRLIGESWPITKERAYFEALALEEYRRLSPEHVPEVYHFDRIMSLIGMKYLKPPHIILRKGLVAGIEYPLLAEHMSAYMASTLYYTSLLYRTTIEHKRAVAEFCGNVELCRHTARVVFSDPYKDALAVREDNTLKLEIAELKSKFCERAQALIHGDLHTGSVMVTHESTQVIDPEFAFYGPMGFDVGAFIGNLILAFFAQDGHADDEGNDRKAYKEWILRTIEETWTLFDKKFIALWDEHKDGSGEAYLPAIYNNPELQLLVQRKFMQDLFHDTLGFGAAKMIRRIVGVAHVEDFESITDASKRAKCERQALEFAKLLLKERRKFQSVAEILSIMDFPVLMETLLKFRPLDEKSLVEYIKATPALFDRLGNSLDGLTIKEVGDGNLNFVYIVVAPAGSFVIKQALPYIRCIGESWPMTKERAYFEYRALTEHGGLSRGHVPEVYHFDHTMALIGMRYLEPPHIILRKGLIAGIEYPLLAEHISDYMANTLYHTSLLSRSTKQTKPADFCGNVVFSDPYKVSEYNRWTSPYLDDDAAAVREDNILKLEVAELKSKFCERAQALIHGDLHTGSVMVTPESTQVIDPEFAFYGPMGFDIGAFIGNLILAFYAQDGHADEANDRKTYKEWILRAIGETWSLFHKKFIALWDKHKDDAGDAYLPEIYNNPELRQLVQSAYMRDLFHDTLGFGAAKMIRRIVGVAHVEDFESIADASKRAKCERQALEFAKLLLKERRKFQSITEVVSAIQKWHG
ncbi:hypothetical protein Tsubulata_013188 [Turnera subulata]|uniref:S-methyl-5-thioribose kinase n=1 Tax=Turnera subulata TaxID=218843 RepID=A0A9Q0FTL3_9ROSI|nr:hypothetical protein Tsubulata_013188 [Turnera subulata]